MDGHSVSMLGTGLIGDFYTNTLHGQRGRDRVRVVYSRSDARGVDFSRRWSIPEHTSDMAAAIEHPDTDVVVVGLPNFLHEEAVGLVAKAGKAVLCTKPLGRTAGEARRMLEVVEGAGVFAGYLEDLCYTPKSLKAVASVRAGAFARRLSSAPVRLSPCRTRRARWPSARGSPAISPPRAPGNAARASTVSRRSPTRLRAGCPATHGPS